MGQRVLYDGEVYALEGIEGFTVRLRSSKGSLAVLTTRELVGAPDFEVLDHDEQEEPNLDTADLNNLPKATKRKAEEMRVHLHEVITGYPFGSPNAPDHPEPKPDYDPTLTSMRQRIASKASELGVSESKLWKLKRRYEESGLYGLIDKRELKAKTVADRLDPRLRAAILQVLDEMTSDSNATYQRILRKAETILEKEKSADQEPVDMPSRATLYRAMKELTTGLGTMGSAKTRRSIANRPNTTYRRFKASRPGEIVLIDSTQLDVFAINPLTLEWVTLDLTIALDLYTRSILAFRFTPRGAGRVDAALLLADIIAPMLMRPGWPDMTRWAYHGVPETIILDLFGTTDVAACPIVRPETVVVDRAMIFESETFLSACKALGVNVQSARKRQPTDKSHIERVFLTIRQGLLEYLPGYKGPDVWSRGVRIEDKALYFVEEIEAIFAEWVVSFYHNEPHEGLHMPGAPKHEVSPNDMYEYGLSAAGFLFVPPSIDIYYQLLPIAWRKIGHDGVMVKRLKYDGDAFNKHRNRPSSYGGKRRGQWPLRFDPRDYSHLYFQDPDDGEWHEIPWVHAPPNARPFNDTLLAHAKKLLLARGGKANVYGSQELADILKGIFDRVDRDRLVDPKERKAMVRGVMQGRQANRDRDRNAHRILPAAETSDDENLSLGSGVPQDNTDPWNVDPSKIKAFPVWGDIESVDDLDDDEEDEY